ncbi:DUF1203 domain-containing protein [Sphingomonas sp.]|uniref:DUF1203 domain-containing protein n=1 Tax=Sphingomonas sp. TaxID=28214 RepID=UPI00333FB0B9
MTYVLRGLDPIPFAALFGLPDAALAERQVVRRFADAKPGFPCRVTLEDAEPGEALLLLNYEHLPVASPYRASHAIYVREGAAAAAVYEDRIPEQLSRRLLSVRAFDAAGMMVEADVIDGVALDALTRDWLGRPQVAYLHVHNAKPGCFAARIDRD